jgi:hypothetical protein
MAQIMAYFEYELNYLYHVHMARLEGNSKIKVLRRSIKE